MSSIELREFLKRKKNVDLSIDPLLEIIPGNTNEITSNNGRISDLDKNIKLVKTEFIGKPYVCHELVVSIIHIRRNIDYDVHEQRFYHLLDKYKEILLKELNLRWLVSICDTIVDTGNEVDSGSAMLVSLLLNSFNIQVTLLDSLSETQPTPEELKNVRCRPTWDGMISAGVIRGDMMYNMITRFNNVVNKSPVISPIWQEIKSRLRDDPAVPVNWLAELNVNFPETFFI